MSRQDYYEVEVPHGFEPMSRPTRDDDRLKGVQVQSIEEKDLPGFAEIIYAAFPSVFWDKIEDAAHRPPLGDRIRLLAKHFSAFYHTPGYHLIKATHADSGQIMGIALWVENGKHPIFPTTYPGFSGLKFPSTFAPCPFRDDLFGPLGFDKKFGWSNDDVKEMYDHHSPAWFQEYQKYDTGRVKEMGDRPHWYLAPVCVSKEYRAAGVGKALMMYGIQKADAADAPLHCVLEALPNAQPVYLHFGFVPTKGHGTSKDSQLVRAPLGRKYEGCS